MTHSVHTLLPEDFKLSLSMLPKNTAISLLTRHSIREEPENYNAHYKLPLTEEGIALAAYWGALQPFEKFHLFSSPIGRCLETAFHMHRGSYVELESAQGSANIQQVSLLAEPGCFIADREIMQKVGQIFVAEGPVSFLNHMMSGKFESYLSVKSGVGKLLEHFLEHQNDQSTEQLNIHVSHDTILAAFVYSLLGKTNLKQEDWPRMMEGVYLWFDETHVHGVWRGQVFKTHLQTFLN